MKICCTAEQFLPCSRRTFAAEQTELCWAADFGVQAALDFFELKNGFTEEKKKKMFVVWNFCVSLHTKI